MIDGRIKEIYEETFLELKNIGIPVSENVEELRINKRPQKRLGRCLREVKKGKEIFVIEISEKTLSLSLKDIKEVMAHELIHTCKQCMNHGEKWKTYAKQVNRAYGYNISRLKKFDETGDEEYKYAVECMRCGAVIKRKRMCPLIKEPRNYRCGKCGGKLKKCEKSTTSCR